MRLGRFALLTSGFGDGIAAFAHGNAQRGSDMWILKGSLAGVGIFISAVLLYVLAWLTYGMYLLVSAAKSGQHGNLGTNWDIRTYVSFVRNPWLWGALIVSVAIGLWIFRMRRPV